MQSGENVTLLCSSKCAFDQFHLLGNWENLGRPLAGGRGPHGTLQAAFPLGPGTPAHSGVYRCYGSFTRSPYVWSDPSDPCSCVSQVRTLLIQIKNFFHDFIYLYLAALGLVAAQAFLTSRGSSPAAAHRFLICGGFSCCGAQALGCASFSSCCMRAR